MSKAFLGRGWKFPVQVDEATGRIMMSDYEDDIAEAIRIIISTSRGERVMRQHFGCSVNNYVFGPTDPTTLRMLENEIKEAIIAWEPRVDAVDIRAELDTEKREKLYINIKYVVRTTNNLFNLVYPFYLYEGIR